MKNKLWQSLVSNIGLKFLAVLLAILLWLVARIDISSSLAN
ncbi:MAG: hypothetical protein WC838_01170 [Candidatus Margulisiibacteriota bacterium]|jgi:hypothetical protein